MSTARTNPTMPRTPRSLRRTRSTSATPTPTAAPRAALETTRPVRTPDGWRRTMSGAAELDPEDAKIVTLARSARARNGAAEGAAVRDTDGRTYVAASVALPSLRLSALQAAVAAAGSSGVEGLGAAAVVARTPALPEPTWSTGRSAPRGQRSPEATMRILTRTRTATPEHATAAPTAAPGT